MDETSLPRSYKIAFWIMIILGAVSLISLLPALTNWFLNFPSLSQLTDWRTFNGYFTPIFLPIMGVFAILFLRGKSRPNKYVSIAVWTFFSSFIYLPFLFILYGLISYIFIPLSILLLTLSFVFLIVGFFKGRKDVMS